MVETLSIAVVRDLAVVLTLAFVVAALFSKLRQPAILGYLLAGALVGPFALGFVRSVETINLFAELGVILLIFSIGLEFNLRRLRRIGSIALLAGTFQMLLTFGIGTTAGRAMGWSAIDSLFLGGILAMSSTAIIVKMLADSGQVHQSYAQIIIGILIVQDIGVVFLLTLFGSIITVGDFYWENIFPAALNIMLFFIVALITGLNIAPRLIDYVARGSGSRELLLLASLGICFTLAVFSNMLGFSLALGAFIAGAIVAESRYEVEIEALTKPLRDIFTTLFFVSIGMLFDASMVGNYAGSVAFVTFLAVIAKAVSSSLGVYLLGQRGTIAVYVGLGLVPIGEFSFVIAKLGVDSGVTGAFLYQVVVATAILTTIMTPHLLNASPLFAQKIERGTPEKLNNFLRYTTLWLSEIRDQMRFDEEANKILKRKSADVAINGIIIILVWLSAVSAGNFLKEVAPPWLDVAIASQVLAAVLMLPSIYLILRRIREIVEMLVHLLGMRIPVFDNAVTKAALQNLILLLLVLLLAVNMFPILMAELFRQSYAIAILLIGVILISGFFFWHTVNTFQENFERIIRETASVIESPAGGRRVKEFEDLLSGIKRGRIIDQIELNAGAAAAGKTISEMRLRTLTGATILSIVRGSEQIRNPKPSERLLQGDLLILLGTEEEREAARKMLHGINTES